MPIYPEFIGGVLASLRSGDFIYNWQNSLTLAQAVHQHSILKSRVYNGA